MLAGRGGDRGWADAWADVGDLQAKGLLGQTLVILGTEFGRTPRINENDGREHHKKDLTCLGWGWDHVWGR